MMFIWIIIIGALIYYFYNGDLKITKKKSPSELLDERLAKGEISVDQYNQIKKVLEESK